MNWLKSLLKQSNSKSINQELSEVDKFNLATKAAIEAYNNQRTFVDNHTFIPKPEPIVWKVMIPLISNYILFYAKGRVHDLGVKTSYESELLLIKLINENLHTLAVDIESHYRNPSHRTISGKIIGYSEGLMGTQKLLANAVLKVSTGSLAKGVYFFEEMTNEGYYTDFSTPNFVMDSLTLGFDEIDNLLKTERF